MVGASGSDLIISKRKAINTLFPYAIYLEQRGQQGMMDAILSVARASNLVASNTGKFMWRQVVLYISRLFEKQSPTSLNRVITLISPYVPWNGALNNKIAVARWAAAALAIPYTEGVGSSVVDALFQIAFIDYLRPYIPIDIWGLLKKEPSLPPMYHGLTRGVHEYTVAHVRGLGDIDILKSYFLLVWTDRVSPDSDGIHEMETSIRENFSGTGMEQHRKDLMQRLDHVLERLDRKLERSSASGDSPSRKSRGKYAVLRDLLSEVGKQ